MPIAAAAGTGIQVGLAIVATRYVIDQAGPASLALWRYAIGALCLLPVVSALRAWPRFRAADLLPIAVLGMVQFGLLIALLNFGLKTISSARGALILATFPLQTMLIAALLGRERLTAAKSLGVLLTILGVGAALGEKAAGGNHGWIGEAAVFASAFCGALCSVLYRPYLQRYPALPVGAVAMLGSVAFLSIPAWGEGVFAAPPHFTPGGWAAILFIGMSSAVGYFLWLWALARATPTRVTVFLALSPITAMLLGAALLGEPITPMGLLGVVLVALGLVVATRGGPQPGPTPSV
ncbi:MAG: DMT family transporter [Alphaproteobacteria bacterium]|nr:DMT family transporter [Alphaproteobacteria bacterium]